METRRRSIVKALSWRVWATLITFFVALAITGETAFALEIGLIDTSAKLFIYFLHERMWLRIKYGRVPDPGDYSI